MQVLRIPLSIPSSALAPPDLLLPRILRTLASASPSPSHSRSPSHPPLPHLAPVLLRLLLTWVSASPPAVAALLSPPAHLPFLLDLTAAHASAPSETAGSEFDASSGGGAAGRGMGSAASEQVRGY